MPIKRKYSRKNSKRNTKRNTKKIRNRSRKRKYNYKKIKTGGSDLLAGVKDGKCTEGRIPGDLMVYGNFCKAGQCGKKTLFGRDKRLNIEDNYLSGLRKDHAGFKEKCGQINIPNGVTHIGDDAFAESEFGDHYITSVTIPDSVIKIGVTAFEKCVMLESVTIGNSVETIGFQAFYKCKSLKSITIPDSVTDIGFSVFSGCNSLESISIPKSLYISKTGYPKKTQVIRRE